MRQFGVIYCYATTMKLQLTYHNYQRIVFLRKLLVAVCIVLGGIGTTMPAATTTQNRPFDWAPEAAFVTFLIGTLVLWLARYDLTYKAWQTGATKFGGTAPGAMDSQVGSAYPPAGPVVSTGSADELETYTTVLAQPASAMRQMSYTYWLSRHYKNENGQFKLEYLVMSVPLNEPVPHIFIDATKQNKFSSKNDDLWSLNKKLFRRNRILDLEGDFYKYFKVYTTRRETLDALTILTPDVMLKLRDDGYNFDYELYGKNLFVIADSTILRAEDFEAFVRAAEACLNELVPQIAGHTFTNLDEQLPVNVARMRRWAIWYSVRILCRKGTFVLLYFLVGITIGYILKSF